VSKTQIIEVLRQLEAYATQTTQVLQVTRNALWKAADALHRFDTPRPTETDDVTAWLTAAHEEEKERQAKGLNDITPKILDVARRIVALHAPKKTPRPQFGNGPMTDAEYLDAHDGNRTSR
jgi:hypothetical protein